MAKSRYIEIDRVKFEDFLRTCGFARTVQGSEVVYVRGNSHCPSVVVKVYTSLPASPERAARGRGEDAIRIVAAYENPKQEFRGSKSFGLFKATRTFRTGSDEAVRDRVYARMQEAYLVTNQWVRKHWEDLKRAGLTADPRQA